MNMIPGVVGADNVIEIHSGRKISVGRDLPEGRSVTLGVRPEDLHPDGENGALEGKVLVREPLGHETLIYVGTPSGEIIAKADGRTPPDVGATVKLSALPENLHVFDAGSGEALS